MSLAFNEVYKNCNINAEGCDKKYDMVQRKEAVKHEIHNTKPRYDACDNPKCQSDGREKGKTGSKTRKKL